MAPFQGLSGLAFLYPNPLLCPVPESTSMLRHQPSVQLLQQREGGSMKTGDGASKSTQCLGTGPGLAEGMQGSTSPGNETSTAIGAVNSIAREELQKGLETPMPPTALSGRAAVHLVPLTVAHSPSTVRQARLPQARAPLVCERHAGLERICVVAGTPLTNVGFGRASTTSDAVLVVVAGTPLTNVGFGRASTTSDAVLVTTATSFPCVKGDNNGSHPGFRDGVITGNTARTTSESRGGGIAVNFLLDTTESGKGAIAFSNLLATAESGEGAVSSNTYFTTVDSGKDAVAGDPVHLTAESGDALGTYHVHGKYYNDRG
eukprot:jgi/Undpi1/2978/HiC_scaffold_14.g06355.m1